MQLKLCKTKENLKQRMELSHPVLSRIEPWMREKLRQAESRFTEDCQWSAHEEALSLCTAQHLHQTVYFLNRDLTFMREVKSQCKNKKLGFRTDLSVCSSQKSELDTIIHQFTVFSRGSLFSQRNFARFRLPPGHSNGLLEYGFLLVGS